LDILCVEIQIDRENSNGKAGKIPLWRHIFEEGGAPRFRRGIEGFSKRILCQSGKLFTFP
jgi:hypothetical protein